MSFPGKPDKDGLKQSLLSSDSNQERKVEDSSKAEENEHINIQVPTEDSILEWIIREGSDVQSPDEEVVRRLDEHKISIPELAERFHTSLDPLRPDQSAGKDSVRAEHELGMTGPNSLTPPRAIPAWKIFLRELCQPLNSMLLFAASLSFLMFAIEEASSWEAFELGCVLVVVTLANTMLDYTQKQKAEKVQCDVH
ncbi:unnamed protein product [Choristocarpus tenellus]